MQAYEAGLKNNDTRLVLKPDSSFFRYFNNPSGGARADKEMSAAPAAPAAPAASAAPVH
jgi:membrane protease subunit HflC